MCERGSRWPVHADIQIGTVHCGDGPSGWRFVIRSSAFETVAKPARPSLSATNWFGAEKVPTRISRPSHGSPRARIGSRRLEWIVELDRPAGVDGFRPVRPDDPRPRRTGGAASLGVRPSQHVEASGFPTARNRGQHGGAAGCSHSQRARLSCSGAAGWALPDFHAHLTGAAGRHQRPGV